jgi:glycosyltransferase involved in cell wall biosynthesis
MKIVYCLNSIRYLGGIQRVTITKANALADISGNEVYILVSDNKDGMQTQSLSDKVNLIDLEINYYDGDSKRSRIANLFVYASKRKKHRKLLYQTLSEIDPDVVISVGQSEKYMLLSMRNRSWKVIREFHFERNYRKQLAETRIEKLIAWIVDFYDFSYKEKKYDRIVVLTEEDKVANWKKWDNVSVIPNPVAFVSDEISKLNNNVIVTLGRLENQKNYSSLINSFKIINRIHPNWLLEIYGSGSQQDKLQLLIDELELRDTVYLKGTTNNATRELTNASIFALSSIMEGLPLVLVEAMECGLPVVSYQCPCGPKDIISDGVDGFLVPVGDEQMMADRICTLIEDEELRRKMGAAAKEKAKKYHIDNITKQWMNLFEELVNR